MQGRVLSYCQEHGLFAAGDKVIVAVSGGADSVALLSVLTGLRERLDIRLTAVHLNHGFRGAESDADADFVTSLCEQLAVDCRTRKVNIPAVLAACGGSAQDVSRRERLRFYHDVARQEGAYTVALGQHRDDQAETVLLHLLRGSGAGGLSGMSPVTLLQGLRLIRPLLREKRTDVEAYLRDVGLTFRTDSSNMGDYYARNLLRNKAMPILKSINAGAVAAIARTADLLRDEDACLESMADTLWRSSVSSDGNSVALPVDTLAGAHVALRRRLVRRAWREICGDNMDLDAVHVEDVVGLLPKQRGRLIELPQAMVALRERDSIVFTRGRLNCAPYQASLPLPGQLILPGGMLLRAVEGASDELGNPWSACGSFPGRELMVRSRLPGDRYRPSGFSGRRKLQDCISEAGVPRPLRSGWPVLLAGDTVVWAPGLRIAHGYEPEQGRQVFTLSLHLGGHGSG